MRRLLVGLVAVFAFAQVASSVGSAQASIAAPNALSAASSFSAPGGYHPLSPTRILDSRTGTGGVRTLGPNVTAFVPVAGRGTIPKSGVAAVAVDITVLTPARSGSVSVWAGGTSWDRSGTVSFTAGHTAQSQIIAPVGANGAIQVRNNIGATVSVVADVSGYFEPGASAGGYRLISRTRLLDTRTRTLGARSTVAFQVGGIGAVGTVSQTATVALNTTVLNPAVAGSISVYDGSVAWNGSTSMTFAKGASDQGVLYRKLSPTGSLTLRNNTSTPIDVVVDAIGVFDGCGQSAGLFCSSGDYRSMDSRPYQDFYAQSDYQLQTGPQITRLPWQGVSAWVINLTLISPTSSGSVSMWTNGHASAASTVTYTKGVTLQRSLIAPVGSDGSVWFHNYGNARMDIVVDVSGYLRGRDAPIAETSFQTADQAAAASYLSCATTSDCLTVGSDGSYLARRNGQWQPRAYGPGTFPTAVSCPEVDWCLVGDIEGYAVFDGAIATSESTGPFGGADEFIEELSCATSTFCMALDVAGEYSIYDGSSWSPPKAMAQPAMALSCSSADSCLAAAVDTKTVYHFDGSAWTATTPGLDRIVSVSCGAPTFCMVGGTGGQVSQFDGASWSSPASAMSATVLDLYCTGTTYCYAAGSQNLAAQFNGSSWTAAAAPPVTVTSRAPALSCPAIKQCILVAGASFKEFDFDGSSWSAAGLRDLPRNNLTAVGCASTTLCVIGDAEGRAATRSAAGRWPLPVQTPSASAIEAIGCPTTTSCLAANADGAVMSYSNGRWSDPIAVDPGHQPAALSCYQGSSPLCVLVTVDGRGSIYDGATWSPPVALDSNGLVAASCAASNFCAVLDAKGGVRMYSAGSWQPRVALANQGGADIACSDSSYCFVTSQWGGDFVLENGNWRFLDKPGAWGSAVECPEHGQCYVLNALGQQGAYLGGGVLHWDDTSFSFESPIYADLGGDSTAHPNRFACPDLNMCVAVGSTTISVLTPPTTPS